MRRLALLVPLALLLATPSALGVVGGSAVDVRNAPWSVLVLHRAGSSGSLCSGAILDATHVLTAAHCVVENGATVPASTLTVRAGVTNAASPVADRQRAGPGGRELSACTAATSSGAKTGGDDVAVLTLTTAARPRPARRRARSRCRARRRSSKFGDSVTLAGFGLKTVNGTIDGTLNGMNGTLVDQSECLPPAYDTANGVLLCAFSGSSSPCSGDSGGALVLAGPTPVVVGVTRAASCSSNSVASYANVTAPEILEFIRGNDSPPTAPRPTTTTTLERPTPIMQVGQTVHCVPGDWSGAPSLSYQFREGANGTVLRTGPSAAYTLRDVDAGRTLLCRVLASNAGGTTFDESLPTALAGRERARPLRRRRPPRRRGGTATLRVQLVDWVRPYGKVDVCVTLAPRIGGKTLPHGDAGRRSSPTVVMQVKVKATAPLNVRARASVTARATDGRVGEQPGVRPSRVSAATRARRERARP